MGFESHWLLFFIQFFFFFLFSGGGGGLNSYSRIFPNRQKFVLLHVFYKFSLYMLKG